MRSYKLLFDILDKNFDKKLGEFHKFLSEQTVDNKKNITIDEFVDSTMFTTKNDKKAAIKELSEFLLKKYQDDLSLEAKNPLVELLIEDYINKKRNIFYTARKIALSLHRSVLLEETVNILESDKMKKLISENIDLQTIYENIQKLDYMHKTDFIEGVKYKENVK